MSKALMAAQARRLTALDNLFDPPVEQTDTGTLTMSYALSDNSAGEERSRRLKNLQFGKKAGRPARQF